MNGIPLALGVAAAASLLSRRAGSRDRRSAEGWVIVLSSGAVSPAGPFETKEQASAELTARRRSLSRWSYTKAKVVRADEARSQLEARQIETLDLAPAVVAELPRATIREAPVGYRINLGRVWGLVHREGPGKARWQVGLVRGPIMPVTTPGEVRAFVRSLARALTMTSRAVEWG
jgi:hypothetical protein